MVYATKKSVAETIEALSSTIKALGITIFSLVNHGQEAQKMKLDLPEMQLLVFGDPKVGTFLMQENPLIGIELPLKILVWANQGKTQIAYPNVMLWHEKFGITKQLPVLEKMMQLFGKLVVESDS